MGSVMLGAISVGGRSRRKCNVVVERCVVETGTLGIIKRIAMSRGMSEDLMVLAFPAVQSRTH